MSLDRYNFNTAGTLTRMTYTGDKSAYGAVSGTIYGFFEPIDNDQNTVALGIKDQAYAFYTSGDTDIRVADILTINSVAYGVRGIRRYTMKRQDFKEVLLELSVKKT